MFFFGVQSHSSQVDREKFVTLMSEPWKQLQPRVLVLSETVPDGISIIPLPNPSIEVRETSPPIKRFIHGQWLGWGSHFIERHGFTEGNVVL